MRPPRGLSTLLPEHLSSCTLMRPPTPALSPALTAACLVWSRHRGSGVCACLCPVQTHLVPFRCSLGSERLQAWLGSLSPASGGRTDGGDTDGFHIREHRARAPALPLAVRTTASQSTSLASLPMGQALPTGKMKVVTSRVEGTEHGLAWPATSGPCRERGSIDDAERVKVLGTRCSDLFEGCHHQGPRPTLTSTSASGGPWAAGERRGC